MWVSQEPNSKSELQTGEVPVKSYFGSTLPCTDSKRRGTAALFPKSRPTPPPPRRRRGHRCLVGCGAAQVSPSWPSWSPFSGHICLHISGTGLGACACMASFCLLPGPLFWLHWVASLWRTRWTSQCPACFLWAAHARPAPTGAWDLYGGLK